MSRRRSKRSTHFISDGRAGKYDLAFIDADKTGYDAYYERVLDAAAHGRRADDRQRAVVGAALPIRRKTTPTTTALRALNAKIHGDTRVDAGLLPTRRRHLYVPEALSDPLPNRPIGGKPFRTRWLTKPYWVPWRRPPCPTETELEGATPLPPQQAPERAAGDVDRRRASAILNVYGPQSRGGRMARLCDRAWARRRRRSQSPAPPPRVPLYRIEKRRSCATEQGRYAVSRRADRSSSAATISVSCCACSKHSKPQLVE